MKCDYDKLINENMNLNSNFNTVMNALTDLDKSLKNVTNASNWDSKVKNDFNDSAVKSFLNNYDNINSKFININDYLAVVITNYKQLDSTRFL